jgi:hypothetical protein
MDESAHRRELLDERRAACAAKPTNQSTHTKREGERERERERERDAPPTPTTVGVILLPDRMCHTVFTHATQRPRRPMSVDFDVLSRSTPHIDYQNKDTQKHTGRGRRTGASASLRSQAAPPLRHAVSLFANVCVGVCVCGVRTQRTCTTKNLKSARQPAAATHPTHAAHSASTRAPAAAAAPSSAITQAPRSARACRRGESGGLLSRRGRSLPATAGSSDTHRDPMTRRCGRTWRRAWSACNDGTPRPPTPH